ncbi:MAG: histidinol dehydrogenase [Thalassobius sp.]|nr:histidinol dehydrogenase [Thalassovita sp.]
MQIIRYPAKNTWSEILERPVMNLEEAEEKVKPIMAAVEEHGDSALKDFTEKFDKVSLDSLEVSRYEIDKAIEQVSEELKASISIARNNIEKFHVIQKELVKKVETMPGVYCWRKSVAIENVGLYIPGGTAPLFSSVLMLGIPAKLAGCKEISLCTPPGKDGKINPVILFTADLVGIKKIYKCGGAQAIAAFTFGTESIKKVDKIFGPGNQFVTAAKQLAAKYGVAIDMPAGPSEVAVLADSTANPKFIAADLLSQAEHGIDSQVIMVTNDAQLASATEAEVKRQVGELPRREIAEKALENSKIILVESIDTGVELINQYAAEHLIIAMDKAESIGEKIVNAGSVFLGHYTPESAGDYASGTNHTLPTNGYARMYSGVSLDSFFKKITFQNITTEGLKQIGITIERMAEAEQLDAHKKAVSIRLEEIRKK